MADKFDGEETFARVASLLLIDFGEPVRFGAGMETNFRTARILVRVHDGYVERGVVS